MDGLKDIFEASPRLRGELEEVRLLATGGMSQIFRAKQPALDRFVVIKKLKAELAGSAETKERFRREAKALASVLHQNIAHVYDYIQSDTDAYILMEYIDGVDLSTVIKKIGHLPEDVAASVLLLVARGVSYMHSHHLIHRDIKPSNIRLTSRGSVKLMDFGIVMDVDKESLTRPGMMVGSPQYLSPEQVLGDPITVNADLFLLGICLYEMLTGVRPFKDEQGETVFQRIREVKYIPVKQMQPGVSKKLAAIVDQCLQKDPEKRFKNVGSLMTALENYLGPVRASRGEEMILKYLDQEALLTPTAGYSDSLVEMKSNPTLKIAILSILLLAVFAAGFFIGKSRNPSVPETNGYPQAKTSAPSKR